MKYKLLATLLTAAMLISPVIGFWHPPPDQEPRPPHTFFAVTINDSYTWTFNETTDNFCDTFTVVVGIVNVTDLFGYEFKLYWDPTRFNLLSYTVETLWPGLQVQIRPAADYDLSVPYEQVVTAVDPALGLNGDIKLATLTFHIQNDVCWTDGPAEGYIYIDDATVKASNSCSGKIDLCSSKYAHWYFKPKQPEIYITPAAINCSRVGTTFEVTVMLKDIVKMTDFNVWLTWSGYHVTNICQDFWTTLLYTTKENVVINEEAFPTAWRTGTTTKDVFSPKCGVNNTYNYGNVHVALTMNSSFPLINGTIWLFKVTFTQCDPWYCGAQPLYTDNLDHTWGLENASTNICFYDGYISTKCADSQGIMWLDGSDVKVTPATYTFMPIPGDLDGSGHTQIEDLMIEADLYGFDNTVTWWCAPINGWSPNALYYYYDLNKDGVIDIFDLVIVAKNFCRDKP